MHWQSQTFKHLHTYNYGVKQLVLLYTLIYLIHHLHNIRVFTLAPLSLGVIVILHRHKDENVYQTTLGTNSALLCTWSSNVPQPAPTSGASSPRQQSSVVTHHTTDVVFHIAASDILTITRLSPRGWLCHKWSHVYLCVCVRVCVCVCV